VTVTRSPTTTPLPPTTVDEPTSTLVPVTPPATTTPTVDPSDYVGHFQRHESTLDLSSDGTGRLLMGASAVDGETWTVTWRPSDPGDRRDSGPSRRLLRPWARGRTCSGTTVLGAVHHRGVR
jgi:hypothetical protein